MQNTNIFKQLDDQYKSFKAKLKGDVGEFAASLALKYGTNEKLNIVKNVFVPLPNGKTAEIDLIIIHSTGIYVIECKNYSGWIFGSAENKNWTQSFANGKKYTFYNPIVQNKYHINSLAKYLSVPENYFKSYIVFGEQSELKKVPADTDKIAIMKVSKLTALVNNDIIHREHLFSDSVVDMFTNKLSALKDTTGKVRQEHIAQVKTDHPKIEKDEKESPADTFISSFFRF